MAGGVRLMVFSDDCASLSLSSFSGPVQVITRTILDVRVVHGIEGVLTDIEVEDMHGVMETVETIVGILED